MPVAPTYPGVYIEEIPSPVRTITPVATSFTAFIGTAPRGGNANIPTHVQSFADFSRQFGESDPTSAMRYAVSQFFQNGGADALIVRVTGPGALPAKVNAGGLPLEAASAGVWGNGIRVRVDQLTKDQGTANASLFNLFVYDTASKTLEEYRNLSTDPNNERSVTQVLKDLSALVKVEAGQIPAGRPSPNVDPSPGSNWFDDGNSSFTQAGNGQDGGAVTETEVLGDSVAKTGMYSLGKRGHLQYPLHPRIGPSRKY